MLLIMNSRLKNLTNVFIIVNLSKSRKSVSNDSFLYYFTYNIIVYVFLPLHFECMLLFFYYPIKS